MNTLSIDYGTIIANGFVQGLIPVIKILTPLFFWVLIPRIIVRIRFKNRHAYSIGAILGCILRFTIGPYGN